MELYVVIILALSICTQAIPIKEHLHGVPAQEDGVEDSVHEKIYKINKKDDLNLFEGDIVVPIQERGELDLRKDGDVDGELEERSKRNAVRDRKRLWLTKVVPYEFGYGFPVDYEKVVHEAIAEYHSKTCIQFKPKTSDDKNWITFVHRKGCWSAVGRSYWLDGIGQDVSLGSGCNQIGTALHEIMHALGFWHEQSRPDRNQYVEILWENIIDDERYNFNKYSHGDIDTLKIPYDFDSIMHYGGKSFSKNGQLTIRSILNPDKKLGQKDGFTNFDLQELNALYDCQNINSPSWSSWSDFGPCSINDCEKFRQRFCTSTNKQQDCPTADYYGVETQTAKCPDAECRAPVQGHWGRWSSWSNCDASCGYGKQTRTRKCDDPPPRFNGTYCVGSSSGVQKCKARSCGLGPDDCEFEVEGMCFWSNDKSNNERYQWERIDGETPSGSTGPTGDHTSKTGFYLYTEGSAPAQAGDKARLVSKTFNATEGRCMSFWYHMKGSGMGSLNVHIQDGNGERKVWSVSGDKGDQWHLGEVTIQSSTAYKVLFESVKGPDFLSDIGLDDVKFKEGICIEAVGCFRDRTTNRTFPKMVANIRSAIDWFNMNKTVQNCAKLAEKKGYKLFALQFYGECWSGDESKIQYDKFGSDPDGCWEGVGGPHSNFVYKIA